MAENWPPPPSPVAPAMNYALWVDRVLAAIIDGLIALLVMFVLYVLLFLVGGIGSMIIGAGEAAVNSRGEPGGLSSLFGCSTCCLFFILPPVSYFTAGLFLGLLNSLNDEFIFLIVEEFFLPSEKSKHMFILYRS